MGRKPKVYNLENKLENERAYHRAYYQNKQLPKKIDKAISLVCDTEENLLKLIDTIGRGALYYIMYPEEK